ncbi:MAG TPA: phosphotransferase family protein [Steroidobacteraceae bacterium]|nr:phosphotransferase family protein [Steroidobacteraceae bacterium]
MSGRKNSVGMLGTDDLFPWVEEAGGGKVVEAKLAAGGNRCVGWSVDLQKRDGQITPLFLRYQTFEDAGGGPYTVRREAEAYAALRDKPVCIPRLVAVHPRYQAMLTERAAGTADYRGLEDLKEKAALARQCVEALAELHAVVASTLDIPSFGGHRTIDEAVRGEIKTWYAMYLESGRTDPLIEFGRIWLEDNRPAVSAPAVLVHGDAGPGNFMFESGRLSALIDWELAHLGDPMEDLAWFSLRSVLEPAPDFPARVREYEAASGSPVNLDRIRFHRVFVSWRIVIIRHCNVSGRAGASVISRALNRRLLIEAIDAVEGSSAASVEKLDVPPREYDGLFEQVLNDIRTVIVPGCDNNKDAILKAKDVAKAVKFMRQLYSIGPEVERWELSELARLLGEAPATLASGRAALSAKIRELAIDIREAHLFFRQSAAFETQLASGSMGALATRHFPPLTN